MMCSEKCSRIRKNVAPHPRSGKRGCTCLLLFGWMTATCCMAQSPSTGMERYEALIRRNPFMPAHTETAAQPASATGTNSFRFTGFVRMGGTVRVGVENVPQCRSYLLAAGQSVDGVRIQDINLHDGYVTLVTGNETLRLDLLEERTTIPTTSPAPAANTIVPVAEVPAEPARRRIVAPKRT